MRVDAVGDYCVLNDQYTFDRFVRGERNLLAATSSQAVAEHPAEAYNPFFIHGKSGLGKTHLMHAIGNHIKDHSPWMKVAYITSERFTNDLVEAIRDKSTEAFRHRYRLLDVLLIDDIHFLEDRRWTQEELFHTFNELYDSKKQIVLSSDRPPEELSNLQERLVSRFHWGLVAEIHVPDFQTRLSILRSKSYQNSLKVDEGVLELIAKRVRNNVRALEGALVKVAAHLDLYEKLNVDALGDLLPLEKTAPRFTLEEIKAEVAAYYRMSVADLEGASRVKAVAHARQMAIYLSREMTQSSFPTLGRAFGNRNHSTIMHAFNKAKGMLDGPLLRHELTDIQHRLQQDKKED